MKSVPALKPALEVVTRLERAGIQCALGGSGLLVALGLWNRAGDWDLTTDEAIDRLLPLLGDLEPLHVGSDALHADQKLQLCGGRVELIVHFAFHVKGGVVHIPTAAGRRWRGLPLGSPEAWAVAYQLLERPEKAERLFRYVERHGADPAMVATLLAEPLPGDVAARLERLPLSGASSVT